MLRVAPPLAAMTLFGSPANGCPKKLFAADSNLIHCRTMEQGVTPCSSKSGMHQLPTAKHRIAVNLDDQEFAALAEMATKHDVSLAWLGRTS